MGAAFVFDWEHCEAIELRLVLPSISPWSRRLTTQRGFFLEFEGIQAMAVDEVPYEVQFPRMPGFEVRRAGKAYAPWPIDEPDATTLITWVQTAAAKNMTISPELMSQIDARSETRVLLKHQFELMFGLSLDASLAPGEWHEQAGDTLWKYKVAAFAELEIYVNHLCLGRGLFSAERVRYLQKSNRGLFEQYADWMCRLQRAGHSLEPQSIELLRVLNHECV